MSKIYVFVLFAIKYMFEMIIHCIQFYCFGHLGRAYKQRVESFYGHFNVTQLEIIYVMPLLKAKLTV